MGSLNCSSCDCGGLLGQTSELVLPHPVTPSKQQVSVPPPRANRLDISEADLQPLVLRMEALWQGYTDRKIVNVMKKQVVPTHNYFSWEQVRSTLKPKHSQIRKLAKPFKYESGAVYTGEWLGGFRDGHGVVEYPNGARFEGQWSYGRPYGFGKFVHADQDVYQGNWRRFHISLKDTFSSASSLYKQKSLASDGFGKIYAVWLWIKQELFKVEPPKRVSEGKRQPQQSKRSPTQFDLREVNNRIQDILDELESAKEELKDISVPSGTRQFSQCLYENGNIYIGEWLDGKRDGKGNLKWNNGDTYEGYWKDDKHHGLGLNTWKSGNVYIGQYFMDDKEGIGEYQWEDGSYYVGEWSNNRMNGIGRHRWANGREYIGYWKDGYRSQYGCMSYRNGNRYIGEFYMDKPHGQGTLYESNGRVQKGMWGDGKFLRAA